MTESVTRFIGPYEFLSNFYPVHVTGGDGRIWPTAEHAFQGQKTENRTQQEWIRNALTPAEAKRRGRHCSLRADWEATKVDVMRRVLQAKFDQHPALKMMLAATDSRPLVEGNTWHDTYWGVCSCAAHFHDGQPTGENQLGKLLMELRAAL